MRNRSWFVILIAAVLVLAVAFAMRGRGHAFMRHLGTTIHGH